MEKGCTLCPHKCGAVRKRSFSDEGTYGFCQMPTNPVVARAALHFGEEPCLSSPQGSGTVFFSGCTLRCRICQNRKISLQGWGIEIDSARLAGIFSELIQQGAQNINLVSGTQFAPAITEALHMAKPSIPVVWNSGGYENVRTIDMLRGYVQIYLPDFKYAQNDLAQRISGVSDYREKAILAIRAMIDQVGPVILDECGRIRSGVVVRHLVLPGHLDNTIAAMDTLSKQFGQDRIWISLMSQYTPCAYLPDLPELNRTLTTFETKKAQNALLDFGFANGYVQDRSAATLDSVPVFDGTGVR